MSERDLKDIVADLDVIASWYGTGSAQYRKVKGLADELAEKAGGRKDVTEGDPTAPTPGPGVKTAKAPVEVDSVGQITERPKPADARLPGSGPADLPH
jgi:hypothetical protein